VSTFLASSWAGALGILLFAGGIGVAVYIQVAAPESLFKGAWARYEAFLDHKAKFLLLKQSGHDIARTQAIAAAILALATALFRAPLIAVVLAVVVAVPPVRLSSLVEARKLRLEQQLDGWLMMLANALKATPAIGEALRSTVTLVQAPFSEELDLIVKENTLGAPLDQALLNASERMESPIISGALATLVIGRQTGGDLPSILETAASSLREMARLEGVVRTKTAEGKGQVVVLAVMPFLMTALLVWMDPHWLDPLSETFLGYSIVAIACVLWIGAIAWARKILDVDI